MSDIWILIHACRKTKSHQHLHIVPKVNNTNVVGKVELLIQYKSYTHCKLYFLEGCITKNSSGIAQRFSMRDDG